jgi:hypothetical protein
MMLIIQTNQVCVYFCYAAHINANHQKYSKKHIFLAVFVSFHLELKKKILATFQKKNPFKIELLFL